MSNFERITASLEVLGAFLAALPVVDSPWDADFRKKFCAVCVREDCDMGPCPHQDERNNPLWWLAQTTKDGLDCESVGNIV